MYIAIIAILHIKFQNALYVIKKQQNIIHFLLDIVVNPVMKKIHAVGSVVFQQINNHHIYT